MIAHYAGLIDEVVAGVRAGFAELREEVPRLNALGI